MLPLFALTIGLSAALLFSVQPMVGKALAPALGGVPAVWTTCLAFFQACLVLGYLYAHVLTKRLELRGQVVLHAAALCAGLALLPLQLDLSHVETQRPTLLLLRTLMLFVFVPVTLVSASAPLLQRWFSLSSHRLAGDPYFLYAASNVGSFCVLLGYPLLAEPLWDLRTQGLLWTFGFAVLALLVVATAVVTTRSARRPAGRAQDDGAAARVDTPRGEVGLWAQRGMWLFAAFVPSSLMMGVTAHISLQFASVPMLWVLPLALYLLTYVLAFARARVVPLKVVAWLTPFGALTLAPTLIGDVAAHHWVLLPFNLLVFFVLALLGHYRLADARPRPARLTEYFILVALGGSLGGLFNAILAPLLFTATLEYPLSIIAACLLLPRLLPREAWRRELRFLAGLTLLCAALLVTTWLLGVEPLGLLAHVLIVGVPTVVCFGAKERPLRFTAGFLIISATLALHVSRSMGDVVYRERNFFGLKTVRIDAERGTVSLLHGDVNHGTQLLDEAGAAVPVAYHHPSGPLGDAFDLYRQADTPRAVAVIGLGVGAALAFLAEEDRAVAFEVDPAVLRIARDRRWFSFLRRCGDRCRIEIADGRTGLRREPARSFGLILVDAFLGGVIHVHLLTAEALDEYVARLGPSGALVLHISNNFFDLEPIVQAAVARRGWCARARFDSRPPGLISSSNYVVIGRRCGDLGGLLDDPRWAPLRAKDGVRPWSDLSSDLVTHVRW